MKDKKISEILLAGCLLVLGILLVIMADSIINICSVILGVLCLVYGGVNVINYLKLNGKTYGNVLNFIYGIMILVLGFVLIFRVNFLKELISFIIGIYIVLSSLLKLHEILVIKKDTNNKLNSSIIMTLILILLGILCICGKFIIPDIIIQVMGIILIIYSIMFIINIFMLKKIDRRIEYEK